jgi:hypothetical protein
MNRALCLPHANRGHEVRALLIVDGVGMCGDCYAGTPVQPVPPSRFTEPTVHARGDHAEIEAEEKQPPGWNFHPSPTQHRAAILRAHQFAVAKPKKNLAVIKKKK